MPKTQCHRLQASARGFVLIEVMVSILLFTVGVLALVGLQANMSQAQSASKVRTDASYLAKELVGVMWSDVTNLSSYGTANCTSYARCNAWQSKVANALPNGVATVTVTAPPGTTKDGDITIQIRWTLPDGQTHNFTTVTTITG
ncbi:MAG: pilus assembly protein PilV [Burkholderiales bacterium]|nr:pilus assembly protein PilV [Burkholderiales bacterium]